jgi:hypothetical protein
MRNIWIKLWSLVFLLFLPILLGGCTSDTTATVQIEYKSNKDTPALIQIEDSYTVNRISIDTETMLVYCMIGEGSIIRLPTGTKQRSSDHPAITISAEALCDMGQTQFDGILAQFDLEVP